MMPCIGKLPMVGFITIPLECMGALDKGFSPDVNEHNLP